VRRRDGRGPRRSPRLSLGAVALGLAVLPGCLAFPGDPPPATCRPGERICYYEPTQDREEVLRCNEGELPDTVLWIVEDACQPEEVCRDAQCQTP